MHCLLTALRRLRCDIPIGGKDAVGNGRVEFVFHMIDHEKDAIVAIVEDKEQKGILDAIRQNLFEIATAYAVRARHCDLWCTRANHPACVACAGECAQAPRVRCGNNAEGLGVHQVLGPGEC